MKCAKRTFPASTKWTKYPRPHSRTRKPIKSHNPAKYVKMIYDNRPKAIIEMVFFFFFNFPRSSFQKLTIVKFVSNVKRFETEYLLALPNGNVLGIRTQIGIKSFKNRSKRILVHNYSGTFDTRVSKYAFFSKTYYRYFNPLIRTCFYIQIRKPLMEKKRRARINHSLDELKRIVVEAEQFVSTIYYLSIRLPTYPNTKCILPRALK